jgi:hypothetical protein
MTSKTWLFIVVTIGCAFAASCKAERDASLPAYQIQSAFSSTKSGLPESLSDTYLFKDGDPNAPQFGVIPYDVKAALWTDGALKNRYLFLPPDEKVSYDKAKERFSFPVGTVLAKHFSTVSGDPLETRIIAKKENNQWYFGTYIWKEGIANLNKNPQTIRAADGQDYRIPSEKECRLCHNIDALETPVIGFTPFQLNHGEGKNNELNILAESDLFVDKTSDIKDFRNVPDPSDVTLPLNVRARAYLAINCSPCHRPNGVAADKNIDLRYETSLEDTRLISEGKIIPGKPEESVLWQTFSASNERMPPLSLRQDPIGTEVLKNWIEQWPK